jgi:hypothetical protein
VDLLVDADIDIVEAVTAQDIAGRSGEWIAAGKGFILIVPEPVNVRRADGLASSVVDVSARTGIDADRGDWRVGVGKNRAARTSEDLGEAEVAESRGRLGIGLIDERRLGRSRPNIPL